MPALCFRCSNHFKVTGPAESGHLHVRLFAHDDIYARTEIRFNLQEAETINWVQNLRTRVSAIGVEPRWAGWRLTEDHLFKVLYLIAVGLDDSTDGSVHLCFVPAWISRRFGIAPIIIEGSGRESKLLLIGFGNTENAVSIIWCDTAQQFVGHDQVARLGSGGSSRRLILFASGFSVWSLSRCRP